MKKDKKSYSDNELEKKLGQSTVPHLAILRRGVIPKAADEIEGSGGVLEPIAGAAGARESEVIKPKRKKRATKANI